MKNNFGLGVVVGFLVGAAAAISGKTVADKVVNEIKEDLTEQSFVSPDGDNTVTLSYGFSKTARGLAYIKVKATSEGKDDACKLIAFAKKSEDMFCGEWVDNGHFKLLIGSGARKQCCDVVFDGEQIEAVYYVLKTA